MDPTDRLNRHPKVVENTNLSQRDDLFYPFAIFEARFSQSCFVLFSYCPKAWSIRWNCYHTSNQMTIPHLQPSVARQTLQRPPTFRPAPSWRPPTPPATTYSPCSNRRKLSPTRLCVHIQIYIYLVKVWRSWDSSRRQCRVYIYYWISKSSSTNTRGRSPPVVTDQLAQNIIFIEFPPKLKIFLLLIRRAHLPLAVAGRTFSLRRTWHVADYLL